jgi:RNA polymerase sigma-70 factor (ECF subfamily)
LASQLAAVARSFDASTRDVTRESSGIESGLASEDTSPSQRAGRHEEAGRLADALAQLPEDQRTAVELHHLEGLTVAETARRMGRTKQSVVGLLFRGLARLREIMGDTP